MSHVPDESSFKCVMCRHVYVFRGTWDLPRCPRCGAQSSLFPEQVARLHFVLARRSPS